ncbi:MAG TPA: GAF domain-containing protein [Terriglobales bacterium]|nr:GAF domain-containing protein [Terriglobales bacterium]
MEKLAILYDASQAVLSTFDLDEVLQRILAIVRDQFRLENGAIYLLDPETRELKLRSSFGRPAEMAAPVPAGSGLTGAAAKLRRPVYAPDVSRDPRYIPVLAATRSEFAIPRMVRDNVVGVLDFQSEQANFFSNETVDLLTLFSTQASIAIENARLHSLEQRRAAQLETINALAKQTASVLDLKELLPKVCALVLESFPVDQVAVLLKEGDLLVVSAQRGMELSRSAAAGDGEHRGCRFPGERRHPRRTGEGRRRRSLRRQAGGAQPRSPRLGLRPGVNMSRGPKPFAKILRGRKNGFTA